MLGQSTPALVSTGGHLDVGRVCWQRDQAPACSDIMASRRRVHAKLHPYGKHCQCAAAFKVGMYVHAAFNLACMRTLPLCHLVPQLKGRPLGPLSQCLRFSSL